MESDGEIDQFLVEPYLFEPPARQRIDVESSSDTDEDFESDRDELNVDERIGNVACCEHCVAFPTAEESRCCRGYAELEEKLDQQQFSCITFNDGFIGNCLNPDVIESLSTSFFIVMGQLEMRSQYTKCIDILPTGELPDGYDIVSANMKEDPSHHVQWLLYAEDFRLKVTQDFDTLTMTFNRAL